MVGRKCAMVWAIATLALLALVPFQIPQHARELWDAFAPRRQSRVAAGAHGSSDTLIEMMSETAEVLFSSVLES